MKKQQICEELFLKELPACEEFKHMPREFWPQVWKIKNKKVVNIFTFGKGWKSHDMVDDKHYIG